MESPTPSSDRTRGFTLAALIVICTIIAIIVAFTVPRQWSMIMKRERDRQTIFIMKQYARAIADWNRRHGGLPTSLDQLKDARSPRLVRGDGEWEDPLTGQVDWIAIPVSALQAGTPNPGTPGTPGFIPGLNRSSGLNQPVAPIQGTGPNGQPANVGAPGAGAAKGGAAPFVGVRPGKTGKSFIELNGAQNYEEWTYTIQDLQNEINAQAQALVQK